MRTLEDIDDLMHGPYGLQATTNTFKSHSSTNFYESSKEWRGIIDTCDQLIAKHHRINPDSPIIGLADMPVIFAFRKAYQRVLQKMPESVADCIQSLEDMRATLEVVKSLDVVTPYETDAELTDFVVSRMKCGQIEPKHIPTLPPLAKKTADGWSKRRAARKQPPVTEWDERTYQQALLFRPDIIAGRIYPNGESKTMGHFVLRKTDGVRGRELVDWAAEDATGVPDVLATFLIMQLQNMTEKRIVNIMDQCH